MAPSFFFPHAARFTLHITGAWDLLGHAADRRRGCPQSSTALARCYFWRRVYLPACMFCSLLVATSTCSIGPRTDGHALLHRRQILEDPILPSSSWKTLLPNDTWSHQSQSICIFFACSDLFCVLMWWHVSFTLRLILALEATMDRHKEAAALLDLCLDPMEPGASDLA